MARETYVYDRAHGAVIPKHLRPVERVARSHLPSPAIISDTLDYVQNPVNGRAYTSKSEYYKAVRAAGCEIVGNENVKAAPKPQLSDPIDDIRQAIAQHASRKPTPRRRRKAHG